MAVAEQLKLDKNAFLRWCASQIGTVEKPKNSNRVPYWLNTAPSLNGSAWCAAFLISGARTLGEDMRNDFGWGPYYVPQIATDAKAAGQWHTTPQAGDWAILGENRYSHIGVVEKVIRSGKAGTTTLIIQTIEGNTSPTSSGSQNNGGGVYRKKRTGSFVKGFFRPKYGSSKPSTSTGSAWSRNDIKALQVQLKLSQDGSFGPNTRARAHAYRAVAADSVSHTVTQIKQVQQYMLGLKADGSIGPKTRAALKLKTMNIQKILKVTPDGNWGPGTDRAFLKFYNDWSGK